MSLSAPVKRTRTGRRAGYVVAVVVNATMLFAANAWPGWDVIPFLTDDTRLVLPLVNASIVANLVANVVYVMRDPRWLKSLGDLVTLGVGIAAMVRIWQVFPFDLNGSAMDWALVARVLLAIGVIGSVIGIIAALGSLFRSVART